MLQKNILLVDDDENILTVLRIRLELMGFKVTACNDPVKALSIFEQEEFHLVLTDQRMEGLRGVELLSEIKKRAPFMPVIIMTAYGRVDDAVVSMKKGAFSYLEKPVDAEELKEIIQRAVEISDIEKKVNLERETWGKVISSIGAALLIVDEQGKILWSNEAEEEILGLELNGNDATLPFEGWQGIIGNSGRYTFEYFQKENNRWFLVSMVKRNDKPEIATLILDISDLKLSQKALLEQEKLEGIVEMAGAVAHEFSQPLQAILLHCGLLRSGTVPFDHESLEKLEKQILFLGELVRKLTDITKYARKDYPGTKGIVDIQRASREER